MTRVLIAVCSMTVASLLCAAAPAPGETAFLNHFDVNKEDLVTTGKNPYFVLEPGYTLVLAGSEDGRAFELTVTVLDQTASIDGVDTRVVEERETVAGVTVEVSRNYYAISKVTHDIYYFGEDVDTYKHGEVTDHEGSWRAGGKNRFGLAMPALPRVGQGYYEELAPGIAVDRARIVAIDDSLSTPDGDFTGVLCVEETSPLEPGVKERKYYAPGIGLIRDGDARLAKRPQ